MRRAAPFIIVASAGILLSLAWPEADVAPVAWIAIAPLVVATRGQRPLRGAALGFAFGLAFFGSLLYWISLVGWIGWGVLVVLQALFLAAFGLAGSLFGRWTSAVVRVGTLAAAWVALEHLRGIAPLGGFTWGELAQSQHDVEWVLRSAGIGGGRLTAFSIVAVNVLIAEMWMNRERVRTAVAAAAAALLALWPALLPAADATGEPVRVAIVQGNVPLHLPEGSEAREEAIVESHKRLTESLPPGIELVVWPESSLGIDITKNEQAAAAVAAAARAVGAPMIVGGNIDLPDSRYMVMAFLVSEDGEILDRYQKTHLVPFGEYVPARDVIGFLPVLEQVPRDAVPGSRPVVFDVAGGRVAPVISFEGDFGRLVRRRIELGGRLLVVATNTSTWGETWASAQHVAMSQVRAAENGVWTVHAALSGISAFVEPGGAVAEATDLWTATTAVHDVRFAKDVTFYARTGEWFPITCLAATAGGLVAAAFRRRRGSSVE